MQFGHFFAAIGMAVAQCGQSLVAGAAAARKLATSFLFWVQQGMALLGM